VVRQGRAPPASGEPPGRPLQGDSPTPPNPGQNPNVPADPGAPSGTPSGPAGDPNACGRDTWGTYAEAFFTQHCVACHPNDANYDTVVSLAPNVAVVVGNGTMPPATPLPAPDKERILTWITCKTPR
jgi:hypothetical protein